MDTKLNNSTVLTKLTLRDHIKTLVNSYYEGMSDSGNPPENVYSMIMEEAELPLIESTMEYTGNNQSTSAKILGISRGSFRKKLNHYGML